MDQGPRGFQRFNDLPPEVQTRAIGFATQTRQDWLVNSLVSKWWRQQTERFGVRDELWYGLDSTVRLTTFLNPFELRLIKIGQFQEGPCRAIAKRLLACAEDLNGPKFAAFPSCMMGVLYTECGKVMITMSGTLSQFTAEGQKKRELLHYLNAEVLKGKGLVVLEGAVGVVKDKRRLVGSTVFNFKYQRLAKDFWAEGTVGEETADTIPGSCALPKLIGKCQEARMVPRWIAEILIRPKPGAKGLKILSFGGAVDTFHHGDCVPSCLNCRALVPLMLDGLDTFCLEQRRQERDSEARAKFLLERSQRKFQLEEQARADALMAAEERCLLVKGCVQAELGGHAFNVIEKYLDLLFEEHQAMVADAVERLERYISEADVLGAVLAKRFATNLRGELLRWAYTTWKSRQDVPRTKKDKRKAQSPIDAFAALWLQDVKPFGFEKQDDDKEVEPFDLNFLLLHAEFGSSGAFGLDELAEITDREIIWPMLSGALEDACNPQTPTKPWNPDDPDG